MKDKAALGMLMAMGSMMDPYGENVKKPNPRKEAFLRGEVPEPKDIKKVIPKGCKEYFFNETGYVFSCVASNLKNATRKFDNFKNNNL